MPVRESSFSTMGESAPELDLVLREHVVLIGMMGAGKTAVGRALSARLGVPMQDSDAEIVASARLSIAEIFERYGEAFFREKETQVIDRLLSGPPSVLSTGGGAWMSEGNRALLTERAAVLWLEADLELLWSPREEQDDPPAPAHRRSAPHAGRDPDRTHAGLPARAAQRPSGPGLVDHTDRRAGAGAPDRGGRGDGGGGERRQRRPRGPRRAQLRGAHRAGAAAARGRGDRRPAATARRHGS
jgi:shikimate kinase